MLLNISKLTTFQTNETKIVSTDLLYLHLEKLISMKKILFTLILGVAISSCSQAQKTEFTPEALKGVLITTDKSERTFQEVINENKGSIVVIDVWASWCADCIKGFPKYKELQKQFPDVVYLYISMDRNWESWIVGAEKHVLTGQHLWAPDGMKGVFGQSIDLDWIPRYMVIDQTGKIALYKAIEADDAKIAAVIKKLQNKKVKFNPNER